MVLFARQQLSSFFFGSRDLLSELRVRAAAEDDNVAHHDDGGDGGGALLRPRTNRCRRRLFREQCAETRSDGWGLVAEGALEKQEVSEHRVIFTSRSVARSNFSRPKVPPASFPFFSPTTTPTPASTE